MNMGGGFLRALLMDLAALYGPPLVLAIAAAILACRRPGSRAAAVCWVTAAVIVTGLVIALRAHEGAWGAAVLPAIILAVSARSVFARCREEEI